MALYAAPNRRDNGLGTVIRVCPLCRGAYLCVYGSLGEAQTQSARRSRSFMVSLSNDKFNPRTDVLFYTGNPTVLTSARYQAITYTSNGRPLDRVLS